MARECDRCERRAVIGHSRSHSNIATKRRMMLNLQPKTIDGRRMLLCTQCIRTLAKAPA